MEKIINKIFYSISIITTGLIGFSIIVEPIAFDMPNRTWGFNIFLALSFINLILTIKEHYEYEKN